MRIGVDLDEVLADTLSAVLPFHNDRYNTSLTRGDFHSYKFWEIWGGSREESVRRVHEFFDSPYAERVTPIAGARDALTRLKEAGHELHVITARSNAFIEHTKRWIGMHFPGLFDEIHFTNFYSVSGEGRTKSSVCKNLGIEVMVEDDLHHASDCATSGIKVILIDYPWNKEESKENVARVSSWDDAVTLIQA